MIKTFARLSLLVLVSFTSIFASPFIKDELLNPKAKELVLKMATELKSKTGINGYIIATNDEMPRGINMVEYVKKFEGNLNKPYVIFIFAPSNQRIGIIPSSPELSALYDEVDVKDEAINVVRDEFDGNSAKDKYNIAIVQSFSELVDQIGKSKNVKMVTTIPNDTHFVVNIIRVLLYLGSILILWGFVIKPFILRIKNGKREK